MLTKWRSSAPLNFSNLFIITMFFLATFSSQLFADDSLSIKSLTHVNKLLQDKQGFIWVGGQQGLTRFDGETSLNFSSETPKTPLPFNWIHDIAQDNNLLIIATETHGIWSVDTKTGLAKKIFANDDDNYFDISVFKGSYYYHNSNNLYQYQTATKKASIITSKKSIYDIVHTNENLYITSKSGLYKLQDKRLINIINEPIVSAISVDDIIIAVTEHNIFAINDSDGLTSLPIEEDIYQITKVYHRNNFFTVNSLGEIKKYSARNLVQLRHGYESIKPVRIKTMYHDSSGVLWLAGNHGVKRIYENSILDHKKVFEIPTNANEIAWFENEIIIGSYGAGLQNFLNKKFDENTNDNLSPQAMTITSLAVVENELFIATFDGLWKLNNESNQVSRVNFPANNKVLLKLKYKNNLLYIATNENGLYAYDLTTQKIIWNITHKNGLSSNEVIDVLPLNNGQLWLATAKGLDIFDPRLKTIKNIKIPDGNKLVSVVFTESKIFAASLGNGIFIFNQQGQLLEHVGKGISFSGLLTNGSDVWAAARPGLYKISAKNFVISMLENTNEYSFVGNSLIQDNILYSSHYGGILELDLTEKPIFHPKVLISKTTISGESYLLNKSIKVSSGNDVITLDIASLDFRPGTAKKFQYRINNNQWQYITGSQLTLTGLASGEYNIEIMATNSLGQWSDIKAYTEINVAFPWYWTVHIRIFYLIIFLFVVGLASWLLYLRTKSIKHIHNLLKDDVRNCGKLMSNIQRNLQLTVTSMENNELEQSKQLISKSLLLLNENVNVQEPDNLAGASLAKAIPFLANYVDNKYQVKLNLTLDDELDNLHYELKSDVYKVVFEAVTSAIFKSEAKKLNLTMQEVKNKLWLTINSDSDSFNQLSSKVNFDLASYTIRQIINKHQASLNTFKNDNGTSQLVISFPLMTLG